MVMGNMFWLLDVTDWWRHHDEIHSMYAKLSNVARDIFPIITHCAGVEASFSLGQDVIGWRQSKTTGKTVSIKVVARQFSGDNNGILADDNPVLDTTNTDNDIELRKSRPK
jgi:hypothetical protein